MFLSLLAALSASLIIVLVGLAGMTLAMILRRIRQRLIMRNFVSFASETGLLETQPESSRYVKYLCQTRDGWNFFCVALMPVRTPEIQEICGRIVDRVMQTVTRQDVLTYSRKLRKQINSEIRAELHSRNIPHSVKMKELRPPGALETITIQN